ncbi:MAG: trehalose-phosphatase [Candidatus Melainabacteria bacterium]|nr:trehalose-phosphatase [Candidatus Melainabacteria bacterium]
MNLRDQLGKQSKVLYIFDYDGTLTPIVEQRNEAILTADQVSAINQVHANENSAVAIVSGRGLNNLQELIDQAPAKLDHSILIIGSHGAEITGQELELDFSEALNSLAKSLEQKFDELDLETKKLSLAVHYRGHPDPKTLVNELKKIAQDYQDQFRIQEGLLVFEFVPKEINKSLAINFLHEQYPEHYLVYFGDDYTDCFAFDRINELGGLSVQIDERIESSARSKIESVAALYSELLT